MTQFSAARHLAHATGLTAPRTTERVVLVEAHGRTLAADITATAPLPGFASAAMDGWVVSGDEPWMLGPPITAGDDIPTEGLAPGAARPISTGAPLPPGAARVIRTERGEPRGATLLEAIAETGHHIREAGEEAAVQDLLIRAWVRLTPPRIGLAAAAGYDALEVVVPPAAQVLVLGDELTTHGHPVPGRIRDVFSPSLASVLSWFGTQPAALDRVGDSLDATTTALREATAPLLVTTGGSARGTADHVRAALGALGAEMLLDGIRMRPGHPLMLARLSDGRLVLCLPGNPLAAYVGLVAIGGPLVDGMLGRALPSLDRIGLAEDVPGGPSTRVVPATRTPGGAAPVEHQGAGMLRGLAEAELLAVIPPSGAATGESVEYLPLPW